MKDTEFKELVLSAIDKLETQGCKSEHDGACLYSGPKRTCCVVGHMMPDDETRKKADSFEESGIYALHHDYNFPWVGQFTEDQIQFLSELQNEHDEISDKRTRTFERTINTMRSLAGDL